MVLANQIWYIFGLFFYLKYICKKFDYFNQSYQGKISYKDPLLKSIWTPTWKSGVGIFMSFGIVQISGLIFSQFGNPMEVTSYLLSIKILNT